MDRSWVCGFARPVGAVYQDVAGTPALFACAEDVTEKETEL
jgi:hypothetical protein